MNSRLTSYRLRRVRTPAVCCSVVSITRGRSHGGVHIGQPRSCGGGERRSFMLCLDGLYSTGGQVPPSQNTCAIGLADSRCSCHVDNYRAFAWCGLAATVPEHSEVGLMRPQPVISWKYTHRCQGTSDLGDPDVRPIDTGSEAALVASVANCRCAHAAVAPDADCPLSSACSARES